MTDRGSRHNLGKDLGRKLSRFHGNPPTIAPSNQNNILKLFNLTKINNVLSMSSKPGDRIFRGTFAESSLIQGDDVVLLLVENLEDVLPPYPGTEVSVDE